MIQIFPELLRRLIALWVRRLNYNPDSSLRNFNKIYLASNGEYYWVVPYYEKIERLEELFYGDFYGDRRKWLDTEINLLAGHASYVGSEMVLIFLVENPTTTLPMQVPN